MRASNLPRTRTTVCADDIAWQMAATPRLEAIPTTGAYLADLSRGELIAYVLDLREDAAALRLTLHAALRTVAVLTGHLERSRQTVIRLHDALREERRAA